MTKTNLINLFIFANLVFFAVAFTARESFFPYHAYDIYRKPLASPNYSGFENMWQVTFRAQEESGIEYDLKNDHLFFFPFDRFLFTEVLFFNTMRVHERSPLDEKANTEEKLKSQLKRYNQTFAQRPIQRLQVYWNDLLLDQRSQNTLDHKTLAFEVTRD